MSYTVLRVATPAANARGETVVNKAYVDARMQDPFVVDQVSTSALGGTPIYSNPTLTGNGGSFATWATDNPSLNSPAFVVGSRILVTGQASSFQNGVYQLIQDGNGVNLDWVLTRVTPNWDSIGVVGGITIGDRVIGSAPAAANGIWTLHQIGTFTTGNQTWLRAIPGAEPVIGSISTSTSDGASNYDTNAMVLNGNTTLTAFSRRVYLTDSANTTITITLPLPSVTKGILVTIMNTTATANTSGITALDTGVGNTNFVDAQGALFRYVNLASGQSITFVSEGTRYRSVNGGYSLA